MFRRMLQRGKYTHTHQGRGVAKMLLCQFREIAELSDVDIIGGDVNTSAHRERGKAKLRSIEEAWEETLRILPPDLGFNVWPD